MKISTGPSEGLLLCARYAVSPNFLGFCGPGKSSSLVEKLREDRADREVRQILSEFETLYPYLRLIAQKNGLRDPFDVRVVEAYWLGNPLLKNVREADYFNFLLNKMQLQRQLDLKSFYRFEEKALETPFLPHHTFHVVNVFKKMRQLGETTIKTMDNCRVNLGQVCAPVLKDGGLYIKASALAWRNNRLAISEPAPRRVKLDFRNNAFLERLREGDWVSFHWGYVCDRLTVRQVRNLEFFTRKALDFFNR